jgi:hypothetical protein
VTERRSVINGTPLDEAGPGISAGPACLRYCVGAGVGVGIKRPGLLRRA